MTHICSTIREVDKDLIDVPSTIQLQGSHQNSFSVYPIMGIIKFLVIQSHTIWKPQIHGLYINYFISLAHRTCVDT